MKKKKRKKGHTKSEIAILNAIQVLLGVIFYGYLKNQTVLKKVLSVSLSYFELFLGVINFEVSSFMW